MFFSKGKYNNSYLKASFPDDSPLEANAPIYLFDPKTREQNILTTSRGAIIRKGGIFCRIHLGETSGAQKIYQLEKEGIIRQVGHMDERGGIPVFDDLDFVQDLENRFKKDNYENLSEKEKKEIDRLTRKVHTDRRKFPPKGTPIFEVWKRTILPVDRHENPLPEGALFTKTWLALDDDTAQNALDQYFEEMRIRQVGVFGDNGTRKFFKEKDYIEGHPELRSILDIKLIKGHIGGIAEGGEVFKIKKAYRGLEPGEIVVQCVIPWPVEEEGTLEKAKQRLIDSGIVKVIGRFKSSPPDGLPVVVEP